MLPQNNEIYRHFKGNLYKVVTLATHSETGEQMVVYQGLYGDFPVYCRPLSMFMSEVAHEKYPEVSQKLRFEKVNELIDIDTSVRTQNAEKSESIEASAIAETSNVSANVQPAGFTHISENVQLSEMTEASVNTQPSEPEDISEVDPLILEFLEAETIIEKKNILTALHHRITDEMINTLAVVLDVVIEEGELEERYQQLKTCLETIERYEIERK